MSNLRFVSIDRIFTKVNRDITSEFDEGDVIEWTGEALEAIGCPRGYEEAVHYAEVKNFTADLPRWLHSIIQVARYNRWSPMRREQESCTKELYGEIAGLFKINLVEEGMSYVPSFNFKADYGAFRSYVYRSPNYTPVRLSNHSFFNSIVCRVEDVNHDIYEKGGRDEYTVLLGKHIKVNFESGMVAIAYLRQVTDEETGYPMVPDNFSYTTAITKYITMKLLQKQCYAGREGACGRADRAESDWQWYCGQAGTNAMMPQGEDEWQNLLDQRSYLIPRHGRFHGFFGNLSVQESRHYNTPRGY